MGGKPTLYKEILLWDVALSAHLVQWVSSSSNALRMPTPQELYLHFTVLIRFSLPT